MVTLKVISDVHTEFHADKGVEFCSTLEAEGVDVLVIAGDFCTWQTNDHSRLVFKNLKQFKKILYVPGNHDHWHAGPGHLMSARFRKLEKAFPNVSVLDNRVLEVQGHRFIGGTMWFPRTEVRGYWSDFAFVHGGQDWIAGQNEAFLDLARNEIRPGDVVITHHLPSYKSVGAVFRDSPTNKFFVTECDELIKQTRPQLLLHGHTHLSADYDLGATRVVCNPFGYPTERTGFRENLLIELKG